MKRLISVFVLIFCVGVGISFAQMRTFSIGGKTVTVDVEKSVKGYYQDDLNGHWRGIPMIIECGAKEYDIAEAQYLLGISYLEGIDRDKNMDEGMKWLKKAADKNLPEAMGEFGTYCSDFGEKELAEKYLLLAAKIPSNWAYYNLGHLYNEVGNMDLAEKYYRLAIEKGPKGQVNAIRNLNILLMNRKPSVNPVFPD